MKRFIRLLPLIALVIASFTPTFAEAARRRPVRPEPARRVVVVRRGWPVHRRLPLVIDRRPNVVIRVAPVRYLPVAIWRPVIVQRPVASRLVWQDAETLFPEEGWAETMFDSNESGDALFLEIVKGRVQFDFAEVVFENGDTQVVDLSRATRGPGVYPLLDFRNGRRVDHVRLVAQAKTSDARVALLLQK